MAKRQQTYQTVIRDSAYYERLGMEVELERLEKQAAEIRQRLQRYPSRILQRLQVAGLGATDQGPQEGQDAAIIPGARPGKRKRTMSAEARRRISEAQKARWAKQRGVSTSEQSAAPVAMEGDRGAARRSARVAETAAGAAGEMTRTVPPETRARMAEAQRRRWAAFRRKTR